jgi:molybdenum cofactor sulfurtransferase
VFFFDSSKMSAKCAAEARAAVLSFFQAPPEYTVVFTANTTGALKLVGESYPFAEGSTFVLCADSHNSINGIREFANKHKARVSYIDATNRGGFDIIVAKVIPFFTCISIPTFICFASL